MKQYFLLTVILALSASFFISDLTWGMGSDIIINEIGAFPTSTHEWIEIWNKGTEPVDLTGWKFWENNTNHALSATTTDSIVAPGEYAAICQNSAAFILDHPVFGGSIFDSSWSSLSENGEEIGLKDAPGNFVEQFPYLPAPEHSLERRTPQIADYSSSNWREHAASDTLGFQNSNYAITTETTSTVTSTPPTDATTTPYSPPLAPSTSSLWMQIKINEFLPDPDSEDEWIELYNPTTTSLDLVDGVLCDNRETSCTIATTSGTIAAQSWATFFLNGSRLNNSGDGVILKNPDGAIIDRVDYGTEALEAPEKGQAIARKNDGVDTDADWAITTSPTPGSSNVIVAPPTLAPPTSGGGSSGGTAGTTSGAPATQTKEKSTTSTAKVSTKGVTGDQVKIIWKISAPRTAAPQEITKLSAAGSADPRGGALFTSWNLGDGATIDGQSIAHAFAASGTYHIMVYATSTQGTTGQQTFSILVAPGLSAHRGEVLISEVFPNPPGTDQGEFIELFNSASTSLSLALWKLETSSGKSFTIPEKTSIKPGECLVFYRAATRLVLDNTKEIVALKTPEDVVIDQVAFNKSEPNQSLSLVDNARSWTTEITPGFLGANKERVLGEKITVKTTLGARPIQKSVRLALADARTLKKGTAVTVEGVVTVSLGNFSTHYFYLADASGGLEIYSSKTNLPPVALGDKVVVTGMMSSAYGAPRVNIASPKAVDIVATNQPLEPETLDLGEIDEGAAGKLAVIKGEITDLKGNQLYIDDGETEAVVYLKTAAHIDKSRLKSGDTLQVTGIVEQTTNGWQIWPRANADLVVLPPNKAELQTGADASTGTEKKYVLITLGGLGLVGLALGLRWHLNKLK